VSSTELTAAQHAVWFTERAAVADGAYQMALGIWFGAGLDEGALGLACAAVVDRHPLLRAAVVMGPDGPVLTDAVQKISLTVGNLDEDVDQLIARPFDLERGPLVRFDLLAGVDRSLLLVTAHHLVFDGASKDILARDLATAYNAALAGEEADLGGFRDRPVPEVSSEPAAHVVSSAQEHWRLHWTAGGQPRLPGLGQPPAVAQPAATVETVVPADVADRIGSMAQRLGVTRFEWILTALHLLLARYGNGGLPVTVALSTRPAGRRDDAAGDIGLHVNELPLAVSPAEGTVLDYAHALRTRLRELYRIRAVPIGQCVSGLRPSAALTPVSVSYRRQGADPSFHGVSAQVDWSMHRAAVANALSWFIVDTPEALRITARHVPAAIPAAAVRSISAHLVTVLRAMLDDPYQPARTLDLLPAAERDTLAGWNDTDRRYPPDATVPALFAAQVAARPEHPAAVDAGAESRHTELSYADLDAASGQLAEVLRARGIGAGHLVAVCLPRSWRALVTLLAIMRCGAAYVPVDPAYPQARRDQILTDADPVLVITTGEPAAEAPPGAATMTDAELGAAPAADRSPLPVIDPAAPAYVMYTSGSTGRPKGVEISHRSLANLLLGMRDLLDAGVDDRWLALTSLSFDISGLEMFLPLVTGGRVVIASELAATDGAEVGELIQRQRVTHVQATPSAWRILLDAGFDAPVVALAGGEALPLALARELRPRVRRLFNVYGPTETTIWSTAAEVPADIEEITIGAPIANTGAHLLDPAGLPVPIGMTGELHLSGAGVALGYLRRPELTAERFIDDAVHGRMYRTGDLCRLRPDGQLIYIGRSDDQIKIRGHRVELGEIEAHLLDHPEVSQAAVVARGEDVQLVAYLVARSGPLDTVAVRNHLGALLPAIMIPSQWMVLAELPRTPNGKLDRAALPDPPLSRPAGLMTPVTPAGRTC
jgi:amino acid adenylation domain-containing protein